MSCEIDSDGCEMPECFTERDRKARKEHICCECFRTIRPGETYRYESGVWGREGKSYKTCPDCISVRAVFVCFWVYGALWEDMELMLRDRGGEVSSAKINALTPKAKEKVLCLIDDIIGEDN